MNDETSETGHAASPRPAGQSVTYMLIVGGLLVAIIGLLAVLWARERSRRVAAETVAAEWQHKYHLQRTFGEMLAGRAGAIQPVRRGDLPTGRVDHDGRQRTVLHLSASAGRRFGFDPGDLILVGEAAPATQPTGG